MSEIPQLTIVVRTLVERRNDISSTLQIKTPGVSKDLTVLAPVNMVPAEPSQGASKRVKRKTSVTDVSSCRWKSPIGILVYLILSV